MEWLKERLTEIELDKSHTSSAIADAGKILHMQSNSTEAEVFKLRGTLSAVDNFNITNGIRRTTNLRDGPYVPCDQNPPSGVRIRICVAIPCPHPLRQLYAYSLQNPDHRIGVSETHLQRRISCVDSPIHVLCQRTSPSGRKPGCSWYRADVAELLGCLLPAPAAVRTCFDQLPCRDHSFHHHALGVRCQDDYSVPPTKGESVRNVLLRPQDFCPLAGFHRFPSIRRRGCVWRD